jgi:hypothetical protein
MFRRNPGKSNSKDASAYSRRSAAADSVWAAQDRLRSGVPTAANRFAEIAAWPLERASYGLRKKLIWPAEDRAQTIGTPARALASAIVVLLAAAAGVAGLIWAAPDGRHNPAPAAVATSPAPLVAVETAHQEAPRPTLHGAAPDFKAAPQKASSEVDPAKAIVSSESAGSTGSESATTSSATATPSSAAKPAAKAATVNGPPAGPAAISVAHDFAAAFLLYETGDSDAGVREEFGKTATPALAKALLRRPPRLPANVKVPKAKVVNVVPAPSNGGIYPVSVSLLRVGLTSELRLEMEQLKGDGWRVTNVLG